MQRSCADGNSPYKRKCWTNSGGPLVNSLLWVPQPPASRSWRIHRARYCLFGGLSRTIFLCLVRFLSSVYFFIYSGSRYCFLKDSEICDGVAYLSLQRHDAESSGTTPCTRIEHVSAPVSCNKTRSAVAVIIKTLTKEDLEMFCFVWDKGKEVKDYFFFLFLFFSSEFWLPPNLFLKRLRMQTNDIWLVLMRCNTFFTWNLILPSAEQKGSEIKGTQDWEFFWLRFWNLRYFFVSYA